MGGGLSEVWRTEMSQWTAKRSNQSILKKISPEYSLEGPMWKLKLQHFGHLMAKNWLTGKDPDARKHWRQEEKGMIEDEVVGWHYRLDGHEFEQAPGIGDGQGSLACCSPWGCKESDMTEGLNWTEGCSWKTASIYIIENWTRPGSHPIWNAAKQNILACG